ncbi:hypothetical protein HAX54_051342, partial [Datura stramonium]|nr:hypothetical protein [Datura stramonium]
DKSILRKPFLANERILMDSEKNEIMFRVKNESITFKDGKRHLLPIEVGNIYVDNIAKNEIGRAKNVFKGSTKKKKAKTEWVKQYLYGTRIRKWVRKSHHKDNSPSGCCKYFALCHDVKSGAS